MFAVKPELAMLFRLHWREFLAGFNEIEYPSPDFS
jgi:hypothetical protein